MTTEQQYLHILNNHLPEQAVEWVYHYLDQHKVHLHITRSRRTKLGDYRWPQQRQHYHSISVNGDLSKPMFLWVFLHEAAHLETHLKYTDVPPHGTEWQHEFRTLLAQHHQWFPSEVQPHLQLYCSRLPLSKPLGNQIIRQLTDPDSQTTTLDDLEPGSRFHLQNKPDLHFRAEQKRRTRWICTNLFDGRQYLVNGVAEVVVENF